MENIHKANVEALLKAVGRHQSQLRTDAEQIGERDLQAIYEALNRDQPIPAEVVGALQAHLHIASMHLHDLGQEVVLQLAPDKEQFEHLVDRYRNHLAVTCGFIQNELESVLQQVEDSEPDLIDVEADVLDKLQSSIDEISGDFKEIEERIIRTLRLNHAE